MELERPRDEAAAPDTASHFVAEPPADDVPAWEEIDIGRYMPRRIRGSYRGRALG